MIITQIVAVAENNVIGKDNQLIWRLPADLKHFKNLTSGHYLITGRKNHDSIGRPLPNRTTIIITRSKEYTAEGCLIVHSIEEAIELAKKANQERVFIMGGGEIYKQSLSITDEIYLTEVKANFEGNTFYPKLDKNEWIEESREENHPDEKNAYHYDFVKLVRKK